MSEADEPRLLSAVRLGARPTSGLDVCHRWMRGGRWRAIHLTVRHTAGPAGSESLVAYGF